MGLHSFSSSWLCAAFALHSSFAAASAAVAGFKKNIVNVAKCEDSNIGLSGSYW